MLSAIGDAVHVLPVANALKRAWPDSRITWVVQPSAYTLARGHPAIDDFVVFSRGRGINAWQGFHDFMRQMKHRRFDLLMGLQVYAKAGLLTALTPARVKLGFDRPRARDAQWLVTNRRIPARGPRHVQDQYLEFIEYLGIDPHPVTWEIPFSDEERTAQQGFFDSLGAASCGVVLGTSKREKNWSVDGYVEVIDAIARDHDLRPVLLGGPSVEERRIADEVLSRSGPAVVDALGDDLRRLMWIIDGSALVVSPDTGPLHIARALDTPVVGLFGPTDPARTGPYRAFEDLTVDGYAVASGERPKTIPRAPAGMERVRVVEVLSKVSHAVKTYVTPSSTES